MKVVTDGDKHGAEIDISGTVREFREMSQALLTLKDRLIIEGEQEQDLFYKNVLNGIEFDLRVQKTSQKQLITIEIVRNVVCFFGPIECFEKLGQSLLNFFNEDMLPGQHFHLDYYEGNELLEPTKHELIFTCK
ncbi:MAG: hypothetical protein NPIRA04_27980 [Nitrospirales bacterium]|nr:MAG: hypothetical protein NPIRA04_27980 [Nitrospirales bacterium]